MGPATDASGKSAQAAGVVYLHVGAHGKVLSDGADAPVVHQDVGRVVVDRGDDAPVSDQRGHAVSTPLSVNSAVFDDTCFRVIQPPGWFC